MATLIEDNGGATTSFGYGVEIGPTGGRRTRSTEVLGGYGTTRSENAYGMNMTWVSNDELLVFYYKTYSITVPQKPFKIGDRTFKVTVKSGVVDPNAPPGGMLYNLKGRPYG